MFKSTHKSFLSKIWEMVEKIKTGVDDRLLLDSKTHYDSCALRSIFCIHFCKFLIIYMIKKKFIFFQISLKGKTIVDID